MWKTFFIIDTKTFWSLHTDVIFYYFEWAKKKNEISYTDKLGTRVILSVCVCVLTSFAPRCPRYFVQIYHDIYLITNSKAKLKPGNDDSVKARKWRFSLTFQKYHWFQNMRGETQSFPPG